MIDSKDLVSYTDVYGQVVRTWTVKGEMIDDDVIWVFHQEGIQVIPHPPKTMDFPTFNLSKVSIVARPAWYEFETRSEREEFVLKLKFGDRLYLTSQRWAPMEY
jgi:hypothetical protein